MKSALQTFTYLVLYTLALIAILAAFILLFHLPLSLKDLFLTALAFFLITGIATAVYLTGSRKITENQPLYTMGAVGIKFFLSMILALIYFVALKYSSLFYILLFFLLYLAFTIFLLRVIIKSLKIKSLK
ncbi:MAG: hypothetical protein V2I34_05925 [Bacteroidales bacterium]|jgi:hypothetical protein|nr:hypothetical protein [Bacteroidales bacterium]